MKHSKRIMNRRQFLRLGGACAAACAGTGAMQGCSTGIPREPARWVLFVTVDTLRADHLGCYGYPRSTTPFLDNLAREAVLFQNAYSSTSHTNPAHASIFTSLEMPQHRIYTNRQAEMDPAIWTMAQMFQENGYETAAFCGVSFLKILNRGFGTFDTPDWVPGPQNHYRKANDTVDRALAWLSTKNQTDRVFVWVHLYDPHPPYMPPDACKDTTCSAPKSEMKSLFTHWLGAQHKSFRKKPWSGDQMAFAEDQNLYDAEILFVDRELERLHAEATQRAPDRNTLWVITSDHGEGLGNHGYRGHGMYIYNEQIHVPLLIRFSSGAFAGARIPNVVRHVDLFPTLAHLAGSDVAKQVIPVRGQSLVPLIKGDAVEAARPLAFAQRRRKNEFEAHTRMWEDDDVYCVQDGAFKFIYRPSGHCEFYNIFTDPYECVNKIERHLPQRDDMEKRAKELFASLTAAGEKITESAMTDENTQELEALGYF